MHQNTEKIVIFGDNTSRDKPQSKCWDNHAKTSQTHFSNYAFYPVLAHCGKKKLVLAISRKISQKYSLTHEFWKYSTVGTVLTAEVVVNFEKIFEVILVAN